MTELLLSPDHELKQNWRCTSPSTILDGLSANEEIDDIPRILKVFIERFAQYYECYPSCGRLDRDRPCLYSTVYDAVSKIESPPMGVSDIIESYNPTLCMVLEKVRTLYCPYYCHDLAEQFIVRFKGPFLDIMELLRIELPLGTGFDACWSTSVELRVRDYAYDKYYHTVPPELELGYVFEYIDPYQNRYYWVDGNDTPEESSKDDSIYSPGDTTLGSVPEVQSCACITDFECSDENYSDDN